MAKQLLIGIDIGTQGTKTTVYSADGSKVSEAFVASTLHRQSPGVVEEDPEKQVESVCSTIRRAVEQADVVNTEVAALAIDGQMAGIIGIGGDGRNVTPYDSWLDSRCSEHIEIMSQQAGEEIIRKTGNAPSFNHGPKILWWKDHYPELYSRVAAFVQPGGYAAMRLCGLEGGEAFVDRSYLHFSGFADNRNSQWDENLCSRFDVEIGKLPRIVVSSEVVGSVVPEMARRCGLKSGTPVVAGCGDTAASFLSCGAAREGICVDVAGTASVFASTTASFQPDIENRVLGCGQSAVPGMWHPYAYINGGGMNLEWFVAQIANRGETGRSSRFTLDDLNRRAEGIDDAFDLPFFVPHFAGRVTPAMPHIRGAWVGLDWSHGIEHLYRSVLEGVVLEYGVYRNVLRKLYPDLVLAEIRVTGGGQKSDLWNRMKASALGAPVVRLEGGGGAPMGSALLAGYGVGIIDDLPSAVERWIQTGSRFEPDNSVTELYRNKIAWYEKLLDILNTFSRERNLG
jgi:xylulokinase